MRVILVAASIAAIGFALMFAMLARISWNRALSNEHKRLAQSAELTIRSVDDAFADAHSILQHMNALQTQGCTPAHLSEMRRLTINSHFVEEIGHVEGDLLKCTSWGVTNVRVTRNDVDVRMPGGLQVVSSVKPLISGGNRMTAVTLGNHNLLMDPTRFVDHAVGDETLVRLAPLGGQAIAIGNEDGPFDAAGNPALLTMPHAGDTDLLLASARNDHWIAIVSEPHSIVYQRFREELFSLLPFGGLFALFLLGALFYTSRNRLSFAGELRSAVQSGELSVQYQPVVELEGHRCIGAEALVRWQRPDGQMVRPDQFVPLAEAKGFISEVTKLVISTVARELSDTLRANRELHVSINLSGQDLADPDLLAVLRHELSDRNILPQQVWLEVTERALVDPEQARAMLAELRQRGHVVAIDDFGTGYSSLSYLGSLPLDVLKIDQSFVRGIGTGSAISNVVPHIIEMAKSLGLETVAEGIEQVEQERALAKSGVTYGQGWLYGRSMPCEEFLQFAAEHARPAAASWNVARLSR